MRTIKLPIPYKKFGNGQRINQKLLQVSRTRKEERNNPFKMGDTHPTHDAEFKNYHPYYGHQQWVARGWKEAKNKKDNERKKMRRKNNPEWAKAQDAKENQAKRDKMGNEAYLEAMRRRSKEHHKNNPEYHAAKAARYHKRVREMYEKLPATLKVEVDEIYALRRQLNEAAIGAGMYGKGANSAKRYAFAVDHIMPIKPKKIKFKGKWCRPYTGYHVPWNLCIMEASENMSKSNKVLPSEG